MKKERKEKISFVSAVYYLESYADSFGNHIPNGDFDVLA